MSNVKEALANWDAADELLAEKIDKLATFMDEYNEVIVEDITAEVKKVVTQITGGTIKFCKYHGIKTITFTNVVVSGTTMSSSMCTTLYKIIGNSKNGADAIGVVSASAVAKCGHVFVNHDGYLGVRISEAGTYSGEIVYA